MAGRASAVRPSARARRSAPLAGLDRDSLARLTGVVCREGNSDIHTARESVPRGANGTPVRPHRAKARIVDETHEEGTRDAGTAGRSWAPPPGRADRTDLHRKWSGRAARLRTELRLDPDPVLGCAFRGASQTDLSPHLPRRAKSPTPARSRRSHGRLERAANYADMIAKYRTCRKPPPCLTNCRL